MKWLDPQWWRGLHTLIAVEVPEEMGEKYRLLVLRKDQNKVRMLEYLACDGEEALHQALDKRPKWPLVLCNRETFKVEHLLEAEQADQAAAAVLGISLDDEADFHAMHFPAAEGREWVALLRHEVIQSWTDRMGEHATRVVDVAYSSAVLLYLLPQGSPEAMDGYWRLKATDAAYPLADGFIVEPDTLRQGTVSERTEADLARAVGVPDAYAWLYGAVLYTWFRDHDPEATEGLEGVLARHTRVSRLTNIAVISAILVGLWAVGLFSLRVQGDRRKAELEQLYAQNLPVLSAINGLDEKIASRQTLRNRLGSRTLRSSKASYYLDRVAAVIPTQVRLNEAVYLPTDEDLKRAGSRDTVSYDMVIRGETGSSAPIADLSERLEEMPWVAELNALRSEMNFQSGLYEFVFLLKIRDV